MMIAACTKHNAAKCVDGLCTDSALPYCDVDGAIAGEPQTCIAVDCSPNEIGACDGDSALVCNASGNGYAAMTCTNGCGSERGCNECIPNGLSCNDGSLESCDSTGKIATTTECSLGCDVDAGAHCKALVPRYLPDVCAIAATSDLTIANSGSLDSDLDASCSGGVVAQPGGPSLCVVHARLITVQAGQTLKVVASAAAVGPMKGRAVAFVADEDLVVAGTVDASGDGMQSGPGGGYVKSGGLGSTTTAFGGAGFHTDGGAGGSDTMQGGASNGGPAMTDPATLTVFQGGPYAGGGGGGALMLVSCRGTIRVSGNLVAGGGGGAGAVQLFGPIGGYGGGAGGYVVIQGAAIEITGGVYANGGGGGAGATATGGGTAQNGVNGLASTAQAPGGSPQSGAGTGGVGGALSNPGGGGAPTTNGDTPGGGGGSVGFIQTYTPSGVMPTLPSATHVSPGFQPNANVPTR